MLLLLDVVPLALLVDVVLMVLMLLLEVVAPMVAAMNSSVSLDTVVYTGIKLGMETQYS